MLFNLYGFDPYRSNRTHSPTLNLIDCDFKYFFDMQALIQVETNNYFVAGEQYDDESDDSLKFLGIAGEDRGARINITSSTFKHSKFCKGLVTYKREETILFDDHKTFLNISSSYDRTVNITDDRNSSFIFIHDSVFENIGYHLVLNSLQERGGDETVAEISNWFDRDWPYFEDRGLILNLKGFAGSVEISNSTIQKNMVYIKDVLIEPYPITQKFIEPTNLKLSRFSINENI